MHKNTWHLIYILKFKILEKKITDINNNILQSYNNDQGFDWTI